MNITTSNLTTDNKEQKESNALLNDKHTPVKSNNTQQKLANISRKLGLSYAIFQR